MSIFRSIFTKMTQTLTSIFGSMFMTNWHVGAKNVCFFGLKLSMFHKRWQFWSIFGIYWHKHWHSECQCSCQFIIKLTQKLTFWMSMFMSIYHKIDTSIDIWGVGNDGMYSALLQLEIIGISCCGIILKFHKMLVQEETCQKPWSHQHHVSCVEHSSDKDYTLSD